MFEQIKHNMETIDGVSIYPIFTLVIFFTFFVGLGVWAFSYKKEKLDELGDLPLQ
ncbi:CcoQ/FixQ family Cbb3-type cytochrome c oxidase assembly chaperone [Flavobacterium cellulosilyticum]|uniref:Cbb3-type cytochrome c oxidase subunit 3 n=1 Tax=Flavobacterium cellulosilyticum TaxID=2541731 RepID=A0A4R5CMB4_9FLAO|nr:CcoQ/FixQ family Cbb3-type cytochrome c oxidase assembly chaperone [Flavobacterium cellulosilyticum]TDD98652.1 cbb3-type cytochrome c oxidase subunit 3 [Flavobacterium cellulosilyticum]